MHPLFSLVWPCVRQGLVIKIYYKKIQNRGLTPKHHDKEEDVAALPKCWNKVSYELLRVSTVQTPEYVKHKELTRERKISSSTFIKWNSKREKIILFQLSSKRIRTRIPWGCYRFTHEQYCCFRYTRYIPEISIWFKCQLWLVNTFSMGIAL